MSQGNISGERIVGNERLEEEVEGSRSIIGRNERREDMRKRMDRTRSERAR